MKTKKELEEQIINITSIIHKEFPELSKYIAEMPANNSENDDVTIKTLEEYYRSLEELVDNYAKTHEGTKVKKKFQGYPPSEDIYRKFKEEKELDPEDLSKNKTPNEPAATANEKDFEQDKSGDDLDVPGSELDDQQESVGSEDEENNYYSLGGDNHNDLDEDKG